jgi:hypothetical protein
MSLPRDPRLLSQAEKEDLYRQIVAAMEAEGAVTDYGKTSLAGWPACVWRIPQGS